MIDRDKFHVHAKFFMDNGLRTGQSYMNALYELDKDLYNKISDTESDCFYDNGRIGAFMEKVFG